MPRTLLALNAGSSSIKCVLYALDSGDNPQPAARARVEGIGTRPRFLAHDPQGRPIGHHEWPSAATGFDTLLEHLLTWAEQHLGPGTLAAVGHRVVHGGPRHVQPETVTPELLQSLEALTPLAPLHQPHNLAPIHAIERRRPHLLQVACFDTAFHQTLPASARRFALPRAWHDAGIRRYGFHGLSFESIAERLRERAPRLARGRVIIAHLGNGASLCALHAGRSVDTSMGLTALDGLVMGTRCGSLDPGAVLHLIRGHGLDPAAVEDLLYRQSGLLGVSGISSDMRELLASADPRAAEAVELFVYRLVREIGALAGVLGGLDGLVFTGGIGARAAPIRQRTCEVLGWMGVALESQANADGAECIGAAGSRVDVRVMEADEEAMIARHTRGRMSTGIGDDPPPGGS